jgi:hypothetical protein
VSGERGAEQNRSGQAGVDLEFRKDFANYRIDPAGGYVAERHVDERFETEQSRSPAGPDGTTPVG